MLKGIVKMLLKRLSKTDQVEFLMDLLEEAAQITGECPVCGKTLDK